MANWLNCDWARLAPRHGVVFSMILALALATIHFWGSIGLVMSLGLLAGWVVTVFVPVKDAVRVLIVQALLGFIILVSGLPMAGSVYSAVAWIFIVALVLQFLALNDYRRISMLLLMALAVMVTSLAGAAPPPLWAGLAFVAGILAPLVFAWSRADPGATAAEPAPRATTPDSAKSFSIAMVMSGFVAGSLLLGTLAFPANPVWVALTFLVVVQAEWAQTLAMAIRRAVGTLLGVLAALPILGSGGNTIEYPVAVILVCGFLAVSLSKVNYVLTVVFMTMLVIAIQGLLQVDTLDAGGQRILATVAGVALSLLATATLHLFRSATSSRSP